MVKLDQLDAQHLQLLSALLSVMPHSDEGLDPLSYRAQHYGDIAKIDWLESIGYIRKEHERYHISLTALVQIGDKRAQELLRICDSLFIELKEHYRRAQRDPVFVDELAVAAGVPLVECREALYYMVEGHWYCGRSTSFFVDSSTCIYPSEAILAYVTFSDVIVQLRSWQAGRIRDRQLQPAIVLPVLPPLGEVQMTQSTERVRPKPDWIDKLPSVQKVLVDEIYIAISQGLRALPCMGVRTVIDMLCVELLRNDKPFKEKTKQLLNDGYILETEKTALDAVIEAGHAAAHRGHVPNQDDLTAILDIAEQLLYRQYIQQESVKRLAANTPPKPKKNDPPKGEV